MILFVSISLPEIALSPNKSSHHQAKAKAVKVQRTEAWGKARSALQKGGFSKATRARISAVFLMGQRELYPSTSYYRPRDRQNAISSIKGAVDGLVDAGVLEADSHKYLDWGPVVLKRDAKEHGGKVGVILQIENLDDMEVGR